VERFALTVPRPPWTTWPSGWPAPAGRPSWTGPAGRTAPARRSCGSWSAGGRPALTGEPKRPPSTTSPTSGPSWTASACTSSTNTARAEQLGLVAQDGQVAQAVAAIGQQHRKVAQHPAGLVAMPAGLPLTGPPAQGSGQSKPVGQLGQQRRPGMAHHTGAVGGDFEARHVLVACTRKVPPSSGGCDLQQAAFSQLRRALALQRQRHTRRSRKPRLRSSEARTGQMNRLVSG
jgi:hypothetical protein